MRRPAAPALAGAAAFAAGALLALGVAAALPAASQADAADSGAGAAYVATGDPEAFPDVPAADAQRLPAEFGEWCSGHGLGAVQTVRAGSGRPCDGGVEYELAALRAESGGSRMVRVACRYDAGTGAFAFSCDDPET